MNILSNNEFNLISDMSKALKSDYIMFYNDKCYGVNDENNNIIKYININPFSHLNRIFVFKSEDIVEMGKKIKNSKSEIKINYDNCNIFIICNDFVISSIYLNHNIINTVFNNINVIDTIHTNKPLLVENNLKNNEDFNKILNLTSSDGMRIFIIDKFTMTMFNSLLNINKSDSVSLIIYPFDQNTFLSRFVIDKKKFILNINIRYMYLTR